MEDKGLQAPSRGDFDPLEEVYDGLNMTEFETNNKGYVSHGFMLKLKNAGSPSNIEKSKFQTHQA
jgi:hypothetical protein